MTIYFMKCYKNLTNYQHVFISFWTFVIVCRQRAPISGPQSVTQHVAVIEYIITNKWHILNQFYIILPEADYMRLLRCLMDEEAAWSNGETHWCNRCFLSSNHPQPAFQSRAYHCWMVKRTELWCTPKMSFQEWWGHVICASQLGRCWQSMSVRII